MLPLLQFMKLKILCAGVLIFHGANLVSREMFWRKKKIELFIKHFMDEKVLRKLYSLY